MKILKHSPKTVALVCMGPSVVDYLTATLTQEFNHKWVDEVWVINMACNSFRADVVFWMDDLIQQHEFRAPLIDALNHWGVPVITSKAHPELVPKSYDYPIDDVARIAIPILGKPYLNNGVAMAIGYALHIGVKKMFIYGADFSYPNRDFAEPGQACTETWITIASTKGMEFALSPGTSLMDTVRDHGIYGYTDQPPITLANGQVFKYFRATEHGAKGKYVPENSSGASDNEHREGAAGQPGSRGEPIAAAPAGNGSNGIEAQRPAPAAVGEPGDGVRDRDTSGRIEGGHLALHDSGGKGGPLPGQAGQPVPLAAGANGRGQKVVGAGAG